MSNPSEVAGTKEIMLVTAEENKTLVRRLLEEGFSQGNADIVDEVLDPNFVCYDPNSETGEVRGAETIKAEIEYFPNALSDLTYTIEDQIAEGDKVVTRYTVSGTHQGELFGRGEEDSRRREEREERETGRREAPRGPRGDEPLRGR